VVTVSKLFLKVDIFDTLQEARLLIERWRQHYNTVRPHSSLGYRIKSIFFASLKLLARSR
jgi:transposase InsO family protein